MKNIFSLTIILLLTFSILFPPLTLAAQTYDMSLTANYNIRIDGAAANDKLSLINLTMADLDNDGKQDIIVVAPHADNNSRTDSGSLYIIYHTLLEKYSGTGNNIDLANPANYNLRYDGAGASHLLGYGNLVIADLDGDGKQDILIGAYAASNNGRTASGSLYVIYNTLIDDYAGTGNNIDLATSSNYSLRYDGAKAGDYLSWAAVNTADLDSDGKQDILVGAHGTDNNSRNASGSLYLIYNTLIDNYSGAGNNIDLATLTNYNLRYDGAAAGDDLSQSGFGIADLDNDGKLDILASAWFADNNSRVDSGSFYVIYNTLIDDYSGTGNNIDLATSSKYNLRYDGAAAGDYFPYCGGLKTADLDNDGKNDILAGAILADNNSRTDSGSLYVIYNTLNDNYSGTGNNIDLATSTNYNLRYDGAVANQLLSDIALGVTDFDNDGKQDVFVGAPELNIEPQNGVIYVIYNTLVDDYLGTGNNVDMANSSNYSLKYTGPTGGHLSFAYTNFVDFNNDGSKDLILPAHESSNNSRTKSGSLYVIYNFPHTLTMEEDYGYGNDNTPTIRESVTASNSTVNVDGVQYRVDNPAVGSAVDWTACTADDGGFGSISQERFSCAITTALNEGEHRIYSRAQDRNGSYTASSHYPPLVFYLDRTGPTIELTQVNGTAYTEKLTSFAFPPSSFFGKITDKLTGEATNTKIASGPKEVKVKLEKKNKQGNYETIESKTIALTQFYWQADYKEITDNTKNTSDKYSTFEYKTAEALLAGNYRLNLTGYDKTENAGTLLVYEFTIGSSASQVTATSTTNSETTAPTTTEPIGSEKTTAVQETVSPTPTKATKPPLFMLVLGSLLVVAASLFLLF